MNGFLKKIIGDKREWKAMEARAKALPRDYRIVYHEIKGYMWKFTTGDGMSTIAILRNLLGLFETSAAAGKPALAVTGKDVAGFCDERLKDGNTYGDNWRRSLNRKLQTKLAA
jgi:DNA-binding ferritin-like protein (Dps family)